MKPPVWLAVAVILAAGLLAGFPVWLLLIVSLALAVGWGVISGRRS